MVDERSGQRSITGVGGSDRSRVRSGSGWRAVLPSTLAGRAVEVAVEVGARTAARDAVRQSVKEARWSADSRRSAVWRPLSLAHGNAGLALAYGQLEACFPGAGWDRIAHFHLAAAAVDAERRPWLPVGMFVGLAGLGFTACSLARGGPRYPRLRDEIDSALAPTAATAAATLAGVDAARGTAVSRFDLISGLAGVVAHLLDRPAHAPTLQAVLHALAVVFGSAEASPWWTPTDLMGNADMAAEYPKGNLNCGLAHGLPGPLAAMSLALLVGLATDGLSNAVDVAATWVTEHRCDDRWGVNWPIAVHVDGGAARPSRSAWCYGGPGVARALWLAGVARDRADWCDLAVAAVEATLRRPVAARAIDSPTFCHGVAGLLQICLRFAHDTGRPVIVDGCSGLAEQLIAMYEPDSRFGFRGIDALGERTEQPGLLDGAPGVALALLAAATDVEPSWDRAFLLS